MDRSKQSLRGFYQYFDSKDELLFALLEETIRESLEDITVFKSLGLGIEDIALAAKVVDLAKKAGLGREIL